MQAAVHGAHSSEGLDLSAVQAVAARVVRVVGVPVGHAVDAEVAAGDDDVVGRQPDSDGAVVVCLVVWVGGVGIRDEHVVALCLVQPLEVMTFGFEEGEGAVGAGLVLERLSCSGGGARRWRRGVAGCFWIFFEIGEFSVPESFNVSYDGRTVDQVFGGAFNF